MARSCQLLGDGESERGSWRKRRLLTLPGPCSWETMEEAPSAILVFLLYLLSGGPVPLRISEHFCNIYIKMLQLHKKLYLIKMP